MLLCPRAMRSPEINRMRATLAKCTGANPLGPKRRIPRKIRAWGINSCHSPKMEWLGITGSFIVFQTNKSQSLRLLRGVAGGQNTTIRAKNEVKSLAVATSSWMPLLHRTASSRLIHSECWTQIDDNGWMTFHMPTCLDSVRNSIGRVQDHHLKHSAMNVARWRMSDDSAEAL